MNPSHPINVLIADDSREFRTILRLFLEHAPDITVIGEASDGHEVLDLLSDQELHPDVLLLDMRMPKMSGIEVLEQLHGQDLPLKVIVMSAHEGAFYERQAIARGAVRYIAKGGDPDNLVQTIREVASEPGGSGQ